MVSTQDRKISLFDIFDTGSYELKRVKRPPVGVGGRVSVSGYGHDIVLMVYVIVLEFDRVWVDGVFLIDNNLLTIFVVVDEADRIVKFVAIGDYSVWVHGGERG